MTRHVALALALALGCNGPDGGGDGTDTRIDAILALTPEVGNGETLYADNCALCHGVNGEGMDGSGAAIAAQTNQELVVDVVLNGNDLGMVGFGDFFTDQEVADVSGFVTQGGLSQ